MGQNALSIEAFRGPQPNAPDGFRHRIGGNGVQKSNPQRLRRHDLSGGDKHLQGAPLAY
jgi:hypothetical protein